MPHKLLTYFDNRFERPPLKKYEQGPFITISRQTGCNGTGIAKDIATALKAYGQKWSFINKEVLEESARKLKMAWRELLWDMVPTHSIIPVPH